MAVVNRNNGSNQFNSISGMGYKQNIAPARDPNNNKVEAQNLALNFDQNNIQLKAKVQHFQGDIYGKDSNKPIGIDNLANVRIDARNASVSLSGKELSNTVNTLVKKETPIVKNLSFDFLPDNRAFIDLKAKKFLNFNVKVKGDLDVNPINNMVRFTPDEIKVNGINVKKALDFFGLKAGEILKIGNPDGSFFTEDDSVYFSPTEFVDSPKIDAHITKIKTEAGSISVYLGEDGVAPYQPKPNANGVSNYVHMETTNLDFGGFNLKNTDLTLVDGTPNDPFDIINDPSKTVIAKGQVSIPETFIETALKKKTAGGSMKNMRFTMPEGQGKLKASMWGFLPIKLDLNFDKSQAGALKVTPNNGTVFGFIPLPNSMLKNTLIKETGGKPDGSGVVVDLGALADLQTAPFKEVKNENGKLILIM